MVDFHRRSRADNDLPRNDGSADPSPLAEILPELLRRRGLAIGEDRSVPSIQHVSRALPINSTVVWPAGAMFTSIHAVS